MNRFLLPLLLAASLHAAEDQVAPGLNQFGISCYQQLPRSGNLIFSPFSISNALSMTLAGARGQTANEIAAVLHQTYPDPAYAGAFGALIGQLNQTGNLAANELRNANAMWVQSGLRLEAEFQQTMQGSYGAPATPLDFAADAERARKTINSWTAEHTKGKIPELFGPGSLGGHTRLVLSSAVYFYGKWAQPFQPKETHAAPFRLGTGSSLDTSFMNQTARFGYTESTAVQILEMKYAGTGFALDILLPKSENGLGDLEKSLTHENLTAWLRDLHNTTAEVAIPKFRVETGFSLRAALSRMGMPAAFRGTADFSGIDGRRDISLADILHKAYVDVSEEGTEAAAATGTVAVLARVEVPSRVVFRADHPFVFLIRDTRSGLILFAGRLANPKR